MQGGPATLTPTMLAKATVVPRAVLDLGLGVNVQKGAFLVAALSCREKSRHVSTWGSSGKGEPRPASVSPRLGPTMWQKGQVVLVSGPSLVNPETQESVSEPRFPDLQVCCEGSPLICVHSATRVNDIDKDW